MMASSLPDGAMVRAVSSECVATGVPQALARTGDVRHLRAPARGDDDLVGGVDGPVDADGVAVDKSGVAHQLLDVALHERKRETDRQREMEMEMEMAMAMAMESLLKNPV